MHTEIKVLTETPIEVPATVVVKERIPMLKNGNSKLGKGIKTFSIPAGATCPGASDLCASACYAKKGAFSWGNVKESVLSAYFRSQSPRFADNMIAEMGRKAKPSVVRIHVAGDLYSFEYAQKWLRIMQEGRAKNGELFSYFLFTRSWIFPEMVPVLKQMADMPNVEVFASLDDEMKANHMDKLPDWIRLADIVESFDDMDKNGAHKGFIACLNQKKQKALVAGGMGRKEASERTYSCEECTFCFSPDRRTDGTLKKNRHVAFAKH